MNHQRNFIYSPGGEHESGNTSSKTNEDQIDSSIPTSVTKEGEAHKPVLEKIKDALREWSNKDEQDQAFDDTRV